MADDPQYGGLSASDAEASAFVGRTAETGELLKALGELRAGSGRVVAVTGEPGVGKTTLLTAVAARARADGIPVVSVAAVADAEPRPDAPLVVVVDDLHVLSEERIVHAERAMRSAATTPTLCLLGYRPRQLSAQYAELLARATSAGPFSAVPLGPLTRQEAAELLGDHSRSDTLYDGALGNPLYLKALGTRGPAHEQAVTAILGELAGLGEHALVALRAAAVLGGPFQPELLAAVADLGMPTTLGALDELTRLDLVRPAERAPQLAIRHRALSEVVYERVPPSLRHGMHRRADAELARRTAPVTLRARHVAQVADPSRPDHATTLISAARSELYDSPSAAVEHLEAAVTLLSDGAEHWYEAHVLLARARMLSGKAADARALLDTLRSAITGSDEAAALADSSRLERHRGRHTEAGAMARAGLAALTEHNGATAAALHVELADHAYTVRDHQSSRHHAETAAALARGHRDRVGESHALAQAALASLFLGDQHTARRQATTAAELVDAAGDLLLSTNLDALLQLGMTEGMLERLDDAERHLERAAALCGRTGQVYIEPDILTVLSNTQLRSGRLRAALATLDRADAILAGDGAPVTAAIIAMVRAETLFWQGGTRDQEAWRASADRALDIVAGSQAAWAISVRCFHAELALHAGGSDPAHARWLLLDAAGGDELSRVAGWRKPRWCDALARAAAAVSDPAATAHWAELAESCAGQLPSAGRRAFAQRARMWDHAVRGDVDSALRSAREAVEGFAAGEERVELCRTLLDAAGVALGAGRTQDVADWLDRAEALAGRCGSARLADTVTSRRQELANRTRPSAPQGPWALLSGREREIARLVSQGMTNHRVAEALFLSVRTVETHLGQIYRKLGVANRASLTHVLLTHGGQHP
ncbi:helix-turn-helix transcriptional regulator [Streptomyces arenae]|uniref:helix-turn-helix transcriptional regulator n=1 Tax=Streptomyces arenae TaxID=29301 RepID=UPI002658680B|nr:LuxR family transcriptional regulator [Streptomyces arenae]MCG7205590.1 LuxR family transcriptional regulator [Streptomyces arenae]